VPSISVFTTAPSSVTSSWPTFISYELLLTMAVSPEVKGAYSATKTLPSKELLNSDRKVRD